MWTLAVPAIICFFVKLFLIHRAWRSLSKNSFSALLLVCALHSLVEIISILSISQGNDSEYLFRAYYIVSSWCLGLVLIYVIEFTKIALPVRNLIYFATITITGLFFLSDVIVSGYVVKSHVITAVKSPNYWIFSTFAILCITLPLLLLAWTIIKESDLLIKIKAIYLLLGLIAPFAGVISVLAMIQLGININAVAIIPILTLSFFIFIIASERDHNITDIRRFMPYTSESKIKSDVIDILDQFTLQEVSYMDSKREIDKCLVKYMGKHYHKKGLKPTLSAFQTNKSTWYSAKERITKE